MSPCVCVGGVVEGAEGRVMEGGGQTGGWAGGTGSGSGLRVGLCPAPGGVSDSVGLLCPRKEPGPQCIPSTQTPAGPSGVCGDAGGRGEGV